MRRKQKRFFTLLEIMIVIFLIGIIGSVIGYNMKGSLDKGRVFRTEQAIAQIEDMLTLQLAAGNTTKEAIEKELVQVLRECGLFKKPDELAKDGWGNPFVATVDEETNSIHVTSKGYEEYRNKKQ